MSSIKIKLSKVQFPECCPVCLDAAEDLVFVTVVERAGDQFDASSWGGDKTKAALDKAKGATTFAVPTCMRHGSKSVRSLRTKLVAVIAFFVLFYPILFFLLQINLALIYSRELLPPLLWFLVTTFVLVLFFIYGFLPRALERAIRFRDVNRIKDALVLTIMNPEYADRFLKMNELHTTDLQPER